MLRSIESSNSLSPAARYGITILSVAAALGLALLLRDFSLQVPLLLMAIAIAVWYGTIGCGLLAIVLSIASLDYFFIPPLYHFEIDLGHLPYFLVFTLFAVVISSLSASRRRAEQLLREARNELESRVVERTAELQRRSADAEAAQQRYSDLVNSVEGIVWEADASSFRFLFVSQHAQRVLGYPVKQWLDEPTFWTDHLHPDDREWAVDFCRRATTDKRNHEFEYRMIAADGRVVWLRDLVTIVVEGDRAFRLRGAMFDITSRKQAETTLREQANLLNLTHDGMFVRDMDSVITFWNRGAEELYGWKAAQAIGKTSHSLLRTVFPMPLEQIEAAVVNTGRWEGELVHTKPDGTQVVVASRWALQRDEQNRPVEVLETNNDITDRKTAEKALRDSEEQWRAVFENNPTMYFIVDAAGDVLSLNPFGAEQLGYTVEELVGRPVLNVFCEADREPVQKKVEQCFEQLGRSMSWEARKVRKDGYVLWVRETGRAMVMKDRPVILVVCEDISERKRAEHELRKTEQRLSTVVSNTPIVVFATDRLGVFTLSEGRGLAAVGLNPHQVVGQSVFDLYRDVPQVLSGVRSALAAHESTDVVEIKDVVFETHFVPFLDEDGVVAGVNGVAINITERMRAEEELRERERRYRYIFQTAAVSIWEEDFSRLKAAIDDLRSQGVSDFRQYIAAHPEFVAEAATMVRIIDVNDATVKLFAAASKDDLLVSLNKIFLPETEDVFAEELIAIAEGRTSLESETVLQTLKGDRLTVLLAITFPSQPDKLDRVLVSIMDITARKRAEEALRESEDRYRRLIELSPDGIGVHYDGRIVFVNPALVEISGATEAEQLLGRSVLDLVHPDSREMVKRRIAYMLTTGAPAPFVEQKFIRLDGTPINVEVAAVPFKYQGLPSVQIIARDITERKRNEEALRQAQADLAHVSRVTTMGELTASLAHEVNQPITAAVMNANSCLRWLGRDDPDVEKARQAASRIVKDGTRAADIISRVRLLFKKGTPQRELIDVNDVIREMILLLNNEAARHSVAVHTDMAADLPQVMVDRVQLQQVLMNLMINAIDAMKSVHRNRELTLTSRRDSGEQIVVSVSDTGVGLPPEADQIFNAFFTTKPHGTGMGLAISRSIVESYGGRLWATSNPDCGTTFHIALPTGVEALPE
jgi:PAS domain S-box-containing protein